MNQTQSVYTEFFQALVKDLPYGLAAKLNNLPTNEWEDTTKDWFENNLYLASYETLPEDRPLADILEALIAEIDWDIVSKTITPKKIKQAIADIDD